MGSQFNLSDKYDLNVIPPEINIKKYKIINDQADINTFIKKLDVITRDLRWCL
jgi:hypothetical protein